MYSLLSCKIFIKIKKIKTSGEGISNIMRISIYTAVKELVPKGVRALCIFHIQVVYKAEKCTVSKTEICLCTLGVQDIPKPGLHIQLPSCRRAIYNPFRNHPIKYLNFIYSAYPNNFQALALL